MENVKKTVEEKIAINNIVGKKVKNHHTINNFVASWSWLVVKSRNHRKCVNETELIREIAMHGNFGNRSLVSLTTIKSWRIFQEWRSSHWTGLSCVLRRGGELERKFRKRMWYGRETRCEWGIFAPRYLSKVVLVMYCRVMWEAIKRIKFCRSSRCLSRERERLGDVTRGL